MVSQKFKTALFAITLLFALTSEAAQARRFRFFPGGSFSRSETIDLVYNLPETDPFIIEDKPADIGYLHGRNGNGYVLYRGDRYSRLSDAQIAKITTVLGFDPTAGHRRKFAPEHAGAIAASDAARKAEQAHKDERIAQGRLLERREGESQEDWLARRDAFLQQHRARRESSSSSSRAFNPWAKTSPSETAENAEAEASASSGDKQPGNIGLISFILVVVFGAIMNRRKIASLISSRSGNGENNKDSSGISTDEAQLSFDQRIARRMADLGQTEGNPPARAPQTALVPGVAMLNGTEMVARPATGFGRKIV